MNPARPWSGPFGHPDTSGITGLPMPGRFRNAFREKRWCYAGIVSPDLFFGAAVVHLGYAASAFCFGLDRETGKLTEFTTVCPPFGRVRYDRNPETGTSRFKGPGRQIEISGDLSENKHLRVNLDRPAITAEVDFSTGGQDFLPVHFPMDMGRGKTAFTTKAAGMRAKGRIRLGGNTFDLSPDSAFALWDWTHGAYHRETFWNWTCGAGRGVEAGDGEASHRIGFNFSRDVYENGQLENTLWVDGQPEPVAAMEYTYDTKAPLSPWTIESEDGRIKLKFFPRGLRRANENYLVLASRFIQPCGRFEGKIMTRSGVELILEDTGGVVEEHFAKW